MFCVCMCVRWGKLFVTCWLRVYRCKCAREFHICLLSAYALYRNRLCVNLWITNQYTATIHPSVQPFIHSVRQSFIHLSWWCLNQPHWEKKERKKEWVVLAACSTKLFLPLESLAELSSKNEERRRRRGGRRRSRLFLTVNSNNNNNINNKNSDNNNNATGDQDREKRRVSEKEGKREDVTTSLKTTTSLLLLFAFMGS